jgi:hypothetical protein
LTNVDLAAEIGKRTTKVLAKLQITAERVFTSLRDAANDAFPLQLAYLVDELPRTLGELKNL